MNKKKDSSKHSQWYLVLILLLFKLCAFWSCSSLYILANKEEFISDTTALNTICETLSTDHNDFLRKLKNRENDIVYDSIDLGYSYKYSSGGYRYEGSINFYIEKIYHNDTIISFSATPMFFRVRPILYTNFKKLYCKYGFVYSDERDMFMPKYTSYTKTTTPIFNVSRIKIPDETRNNDLYKHIMSPYSRFNYDAFNRVDTLKNELGSNNMLSVIDNLLYSMNPVTRLHACEFIMRHSKHFAPDYLEIANTIISETPEIVRQNGCFTWIESAECTINPKCDGFREKFGNTNKNME